MTLSKWKIARLNKFIYETPSGLQSRRLKIHVQRDPRQLSRNAYCFKPIPSTAYNDQVHHVDTLDCQKSPDPSVHLASTDEGAYSCIRYYLFFAAQTITLSESNWGRSDGRSIPDGTMITMRRMIMPMMMHIRIFTSFHHICFLILFAPLRKFCAEVARLSVLSCKASRCSPRWPTELMFSFIASMVSSICYQGQMSVP
jgi:hypothetical protein